MDSELNTKNVDIQTKILSVILIIIGFSSFYPFFSRGVGQLLLDDAPNVIVEYFLVITFVNGGAVCFLFGVLFYRGVLVSYHSADATIKEKAKTQLFGIVMGSPFFVAVSLVIIQVSEGFIWKVIWSFCLLYIVYLVVDSLRVIRSSR